MVTRLFVVHGMGVFDETWVKPVEDQLAAIYGQYETLSSIARKSRFTIHPIRYDDILSDLVKKWQTDATAISKLSEGVGAGTAEALVGWLKTAGKGFQWTHAADVLLYRCFSDVREAVVVTVANQMFKVINAESDEDSGSALGSARAFTRYRRRTRRSPRAVDDRVRWRCQDLSSGRQSRVRHDGRQCQPRPRDRRGCADLDRATRQGLQFESRLSELCHGEACARPVHHPTNVRPGGVAGRGDSAAGQIPVSPRQPLQRPEHSRAQTLPESPGCTHPLMRLLADQKSVISAAEENKALKEFTDFGQVPIETAKAELKRLELMQPARSDNWTIVRSIWDAFFGA